MDTKNLKIVKLISKNVRGIKAVEISPEGDVVEITGKNGDGKTSVIDSIFYALAGGRQIPDDVVRDGEDKAEIELDMGNVVIHRSITGNSKKLKITMGDGFEVRSPQSLLNKLTQELSFNPLEFSRMKSDEQVDVLCELIGLDLDKFDAKYDKVYDKRREVGVSRKHYKGEMKGLEEDIDVEGMDEIEDIDVDKLQERRDKINKRLGEDDYLHKQMDENKNHIDEIVDKIKALKSKLKELETKQDDMLDKILTDSQIEKLESMKEEVDNRLQDVSKIEKYKRYSEAKEKYEKTDKKYDKLSDMLDKIKANKEKAVKEAKMPIKGLSVVDGCITFEGKRFEILSSSERLLVSTSIVMAMNPDLRVILMEDGALLDSENMEVLKEIAQEKDYQIWVERVESDSDSAIIIEEGEVKDVQE